MSVRIAKIDCRGKDDGELSALADLLIREDSPAESSDMRAIEDSVAAIICDVRERGDAAVLEYTERFDKAVLASDAIELSRSERDEAYERFSLEQPELLETLELAAKRIAAYHAQQQIADFSLNERKDGGENGGIAGREAAAGVRIGQRVLPLERVGVYVPGGTAAYPSTVLMNVIPAKIAGVSEVVMVSPPDKNGELNAAVLAAAKIAGADRVLRIGGAQAVAALAYGTESIPRVNKITGPGNIYVATAKKQVFGRVDIDMIAGPSEILIIADDTANAKFVAADMLSQAEHDKMASAILITDDESFAHMVEVELLNQLSELPRAEIAEASVENRGKIILVDNLDAALHIANDLAPEHLELMCDNPFEMMKKIRNAGSIFLGKYTPEPLGDYLAGPNHTLPTSGTAKFSSPLSVYDFLKRSSYIAFSREALCDIGEHVVRFATAEGLDAHGKAVAVRMREEK